MKAVYIYDFKTVLAVLKALKWAGIEANFCKAKMNGETVAAPDGKPMWEIWWTEENA